MQELPDGIEGSFAVNTEKLVRAPLAKPAAVASARAESKAAHARREDDIATWSR